MIAFRARRRFRFAMLMLLAAVFAVFGLAWRIHRLHVLRALANPPVVIVRR